MISYKNNLNTAKNEIKNASKKESAIASSANQRSTATAATGN